jgi:histidyl-tRNA synthetase
LAEKKQFRAIRGTRDILPPDSALWNRFEQTAREVFESYNFGEIRLPIFEETELFARSIGVETDVVSKEMFTFPQGFGSQLGAGFGGFPPVIELKTEARKSTTDIVARSSADDPDDLVTLRPEATASVVRAYIEHGMHTLPGNVKLYYFGPMFRRERPQKGRYRQFYQIGAEVLGQSDAPAIDAELIEMLLTFFARVELSSTTLYINSIGDKNCRPQYVELLREELRKVKDRLGGDSRRRIETNPLRVLDSKLPEEQAVIKELPRISDHLCNECREHFAKLKDELKLRGIAYEENWRLVRGLDYYTRTTFEVTAVGLGSQNAVCGGGRYDGLVELLGGPPTKGMGFAIGSDRAILSIQEIGNRPDLPGLSVFVAWMGEKAYPGAVSIAKKLRDCGLSVELPPEEMKFKKSLGLADKLRARYALIIGEDEVASQTYTLKRLSDAEQKKLGESDLLEYLESERRS